MSSKGKPQQVKYAAVSEILTPNSTTVQVTKTCHRKTRKTLRDGEPLRCLCRVYASYQSSEA